MFSAHIVYLVYIRLNSSEIPDKAEQLGGERINEAGGVAACDVGAG